MTIHPKDSSFVRIKWEKNTQGKFMGVEKKHQGTHFTGSGGTVCRSAQGKNIDYGGRIPFKMIEHLQMKITIVTN